VLDARDREGLAGPRRRDADPHGGRSSVARVCADAGLPCALFTSAFGPGLAAEAMALPRVVVARTGPVFVPWEERHDAVAWLDTLDAGGQVEVDGQAHWHSVYGPDLIDGVLDLLLDQAAGAFNFVPRKPVEAAEVARKLAVLADREPGSVQVTGTQGPAPQGAIHPTSYLAPVDSMLERFVRERRHARQQGEGAVERREDEPRMEEAV
jgi:dTDP-4-dehydrorhamnose reductase